MDLPGYDAWKLATPPEYERECECSPGSGDDCEGGDDCECVCHFDSSDAYDTLDEAEMSR